MSIDLSPLARFPFADCCSRCSYLLISSHYYPICSFFSQCLLSLIAFSFPPFLYFLLFIGWVYGLMNCCHHHFFCFCQCLQALQAVFSPSLWLMCSLGRPLSRQPASQSVSLSVFALCLEVPFSLSLSRTKQHTDNRESRQAGSNFIFNRRLSLPLGLRICEQSLCFAFFLTSCANI